MKRLLFVLCAMLMLVAPLTALAQDPGSGGPIIQGNGGTSVGSLNYIRCAGADCRDVTVWLVAPGVLTLDENANYITGEGSLAESYEVNEDNTVFTFHLRDDVFWSDGEQVDANDFIFSYYAYANADAFESPYSYVVAPIKSVEIVDPQTVVVTMNEALCTNLSSSFPTGIIPSHAFGWVDGQDPAEFDWASLIDHEYDTNPSVSGGPFVFTDMTPGERVTLSANENYADGPVLPEGWLYLNVPDQTVLAERFMAGDLNVIEDPQESTRQEMRDDENIQEYSYTGNTWDYIGLNHANPDNPQNGVELDADGNVVLDENGLPVTIPQDPHPIFGDVRVRQAIQYGINLDEIMEKAVFGDGTPMSSHELPTSWAYNPDLAPRGYDLDMARQLLDEAGWVSTGDPLVEGGDGLRTCQGCANAEEGHEFVFELLTNAGNTRREQIGELVQDQLALLGIQVDFVAIDFNQLLEIGDSQAFDAILLGWSNAFPPDPDEVGRFDSASDIVGSGFNNVSYVNPEVDRLLYEGRSVAGCSHEDRAELYHQVQQIFHDEQLYIWLFARNGFYGAQNTIENWLPAPNQLFFNVTDWVIAK